MNKISEDLYQFSMCIPGMEFTLHQYLLLAEEPVLISTGTKMQAEQILPEIKELLGDKALKYVFVPHFESDECGGLSILQKEYPNLITICSELCARELMGFGYTGEMQAKKQGEILKGERFDFKFIDYPSEVHLQNGLVFYEETRKIFFSSDLMLRFGKGTGESINSSWEEEVQAIGMRSIPNEEMLSALKGRLLEVSPEFIAVGHGFCVNCK